MATACEFPVKIEVPPEDTDGKQHLLLSSWGLPQAILNGYLKIKEMLPWQYKCFSTKGVLKGKNLILIAPTSAGKMLIAEITAIKVLTSEGKNKKVLIVMPYVAAVKRAEAHLQSLFTSVEPTISVEAFTGNCTQYDRFLKADIAICTIEKAYALWVETFVQKKNYELGLLIVDELHMIGEGQRGSILELLLTNILYRDRETRSIQIIGMSATLPNVKLVAEWLKADYYDSPDARPIKLVEKIKIGSNLYERKDKILSSNCEEDSDSFLKTTCYDRIANNHSVIIFCPTKDQCESLAETLAASELPAAAQSCLDNSALIKVYQNLKDEESEILNKAVCKGVGYHHAELSAKSRKVIEDAFHNGQLKVIVSTTTLSMGINLPAHLVIVRSPKDGICNILCNRVYKQMVGRAGRQGFVNVKCGESILICETNEEADGWKLFESELEPIHSRLNFRRTKYVKEEPLRKGLLDIANNRVTEKEFCAYFSSTFFSKDSGMDIDMFHRAKQYLLDNNFISNGEEKSTFCISPLGLATQHSNLFPECALILFKNLNKMEELVKPHIMRAVYSVRNTIMVK